MCLVALAAGCLELAGMLPFLSALAMIDRADLPLAVSASLIGTYVVVMVTPASALAVARGAAGARLLPALHRLGQLTSRHAQALLATAFMAVGGLGTVQCAIDLGFLPS